MKTVTLETIHKEIVDLKGDMIFLKHAMEENFELSEWAKKELAESRKILDSELVSHEEVKRRLLRR